jgi:hypothetical protein
VAGAAGAVSRPEQDRSRPEQTGVQVQLEQTGAPVQTGADRSISGGDKSKRSEGSDRQPDHLAVDPAAVGGWLSAVREQHGMMCNNKT